MKITLTPNQIQQLESLAGSPNDSRFGWCYPEDRCWLWEIISTLPTDATIVEIGTFRAKSAAVILLACLKSSKRVYTVDPFVDYKHHTGIMASERFQVNFGALYENTRRSLEGLPVTLLHCTSERAAREWHEDLVDFLWIDGNHAEDAVYRDLVSWFPLVKEGGILSGHDWSVRSVRAAVRAFLRDKPYELEVENNNWWFRKGEGT